MRYRYSFTPEETQAILAQHYPWALKGNQMEQYATKEAAFEAFMREELDRMDAIEKLQDQFNMSAHEAEALVEAWES